MKNAGTKEKIIKAFLKLSAEKQKIGVGLLDILDAAGVSTTAFYHCFESKHELILGTIDYLFSVECSKDEKEPVRTVLSSVIKTAEQNEYLISEFASGKKYYDHLCITIRDSFLNAIVLETKQHIESDPSLTGSDASSFSNELARLFAFIFTFLVIVKAERHEKTGDLKSYLNDEKVLKEIFCMKDLEKFFENPFVYYLKDFTLPKPKSTKARLIAALEELGENVSFESLDVADICNKAGVSRASFYRHFFNKLDLRNNTLLVEICRYTSGEVAGFDKLLMNNLYGNPLNYNNEDDIFFFINSIFRPDIENGVTHMSPDIKVPEYIPESLSYAITYFLFDRAKNTPYEEVLPKLSLSRFTDIVWTC